MLLRLQFLGRDAAGSNDHVQMANDYQILHLKPALVVTPCRLHNISCLRKAWKIAYLCYNSKIGIFCCCPVFLFGYQLAYIIAISVSLFRNLSLKPSSQNHTTCCWPDVGLVSWQAAAALLGLQGPQCCSSSPGFCKAAQHQRGPCWSGSPR